MAVLLSCAVALFCSSFLEFSMGNQLFSSSAISRAWERADSNFQGH